MVCVWVLNNNTYAQIRVINNKGTFFQVDTSKWVLSGLDIYNKNTVGNVGIGTFPNNARFVVSNGESAILPAFKLKYPFSGALSDSILTWNPSDSTVRKITFSQLLNDNTIRSLNGLTVSTQTFATGTSGTDFNIVSSGSIHTFHFPNASISNRGLLTNTDWITFNNKIGSVTATTIAAVTTVGTTATINNTGAFWNANQLQGRNISTTAPTDGQILTWNNTSSLWEPKDNSADLSAVVEIYDAAGTQNLSSTFAAISFASTNISETGYTVGGGGSQITISTAGTYRITYRITAKVTNNTGTGGEFRLMQNGSEVPGTLAYTVHINSSRDKNTITVVKIVTVAANDIFRVEGRKYSGGNLSLYANGSSLIIERIK